MATYHRRPGTEVVTPSRRPGIPKIPKRPVKTGDHIVGTQSANGHISFSAEPQPHVSEVAARAEAERLLNNCTDHSVSFVVAEVKGVVKRANVEWK